MFIVIKNTCNHINLSYTAEHTTDERGLKTLKN